MTTDAAFLRNQADLASGKASARLREIADRLEPEPEPRWTFDRCIVCLHDRERHDDAAGCIECRCVRWV